MDKEIKWTIKKGVPYPLGISRYGSGVNFAIEVHREHVCELLIYVEREKEPATVIVLDEQYRFGDVLAVYIEDFRYENYEYIYRIDGELAKDIYAVSLKGKRKFGEWERGAAKPFRCGFFAGEFNWGNDVRAFLPLNEVVLYGMHVRGFTMHSSSKVSNRGSFAGIVEKIPYLKDLGINQIELMPVYEFPEEIKTWEDQGAEHLDELQKSCVNYWGYAEENYYFAVKKTYACSEDAETEFKTMVKELHRNGIEVILEFYFLKGTRLSFILDCLRYWVLEYHIDGFHLTGEKPWIGEIVKEPVLAGTKFYCVGNEAAYFGIGQSQKEDTRQVAFTSTDYLTNMRSFLKGDSGKVRDVLYYMRRNRSQAGYVNYFVNHDGFTMMDMVSFEHKHNEANGERNRDGWDYNISWNCGAEGKTRKTKVLEIRMRQMKNAWVMLLLSQGIPYLQAGDERCNSQNGNNNTYCQDNMTGWLNWRTPKYYEELYDFVKQLIQLRRQHPIFHLPDEVKMIDEKGIGYPDLSFHSDKAWYIDYRRADHYLGMLYCGEYARTKEGVDDYFYIACNMHWNQHDFALPNLPTDRQWQYLIDTGKRNSIYNIEEDAAVIDKTLQIPPRCIVVLIGKKVKTRGKRIRKKVDKPEKKC